MFILVRYQRIKNIALIKFDGVTSDFPNVICHLQLKIEGKLLFLFTRVVWQHCDLHELRFDNRRKAVKRIGKASLCAPMDVSVEDNSFWKNRINNWFVFGLISSIYIAMIRLESVDSTRAH
jgi:hypothetical protein